jgi:hypothetical protein
MRIVENSSSCLRLRDRTFLISVVCLGGAAVTLVRAALHPDQPGMLVSAAMFIIFAFAFLRATDVTFDKEKRLCDIRRLDVMRRKRMRFAFADIVDARVEIAPVEEPAVLSCRLSLVTTSGVVPLSAGYEPDEQRYDTMREAVLDTVIATGPRPPAADPVRMLVEEGRIIDAMAVLRRREGVSMATALTRVNTLRDELRA